MVESTIDINLYKRALLEELIVEVTGMKPKGEGNITWYEICAYNKVIQLMETRLDKFKEDIDNE